MLINNYYTICTNLGNLLNNTRKVALITLCLKKAPFDLIFCRNVMIYFEMETKLALVKRFYDVLRPGGYLFIGHAESIPRDSTDYEYIKPAIYRRPLK